LATEISFFDEKYVIMAEFTITFVRHGETEENKQKIIQGHLDTNLSSKGCCQARLCSMRLQNEMFTHVYCSDLKRALQTCELMLDQNEQTKCEVVIDKRLRERKLGVVQGRTYDEYVAMAAKHHCTSVKDFTPDQAETTDEVRQRAVAFFNDLCVALHRPSINDAVKSTTVLPHSDTTSCTSGYSSTTSTETTPPHSPNSITDNLTTTDSVNSPHTHYQYNMEHVRMEPQDGGGSEDSTPRPSPPHPAIFESNLTPRPSPPHPVTYHSPESTTISQSKTVHSSLDPSDSLDIPHPVTGLPTTSDPGALFSTSPSQVGSGSLHGVVRKAEIRSWIDTSSALFPCPNVSLQPIEENILQSEKAAMTMMEQACFSRSMSSGRLESMSSGRMNSSIDSFEDWGLAPPTLGDVLIVSHGGLIRELTCHLVEKLGCEWMGSPAVFKKEYVQVPKNTAISKFIVTLPLADSSTHVSSSLGEKASVICLCINDHDHLSADTSLGMDPLLHTGAL